MNFVTMPNIVKNIEVDSFTSIFSVGGKFTNPQNPIKMGCVKEFKLPTIRLFFHYSYLDNCQVKWNVALVKQLTVLDFPMTSGLS